MMNQLQERIYKRIFDNYLETEPNNYEELYYLDAWSLLIDVWELYEK